MVKRHISSIPEVGFVNKGTDLIKAATISGKTLNGSAMNSLSGILYQLNSLATIANELFQSVLDSSKETYTRINNISERVTSVNGKLANIEEYIEKNSAQFYANGSYKLTEQNQKVFRQKTEHCVDANNMPPALKWQYETNTESLPNFDILNEYHEKKDCLKDFSDPGFFFESWASFELAKIEKRRVDKARKPKKEKVATIEKSDPKYDKYGFAKDDGKKQQQTQRTDDHDENDLPPPPPDDSDDIPPPPDDDIPAPPQWDDDEPPPPPMDDEEGMENQNYYQPPTPPVVQNKPPVPQPQRTGPPPPGPPVAPPVAPSLPPPPPEGSGITFTKKNHTAQTVAPSGRNNLLDALRNQDNAKMLKKVTIETKPVEPVKEANSIASILENKFAKTMDSDDDSDHDDDDW